MLSRSAHGDGLFPEAFSKIPMYVRGGAGVIGDVYQQDYAASDAATTTGGASSLGDTNSIWANVIAPTAAGIDMESGPAFGVLLQTAADDDLKLFTFYGFVNAMVIDTGGSVAIGDPLGLNTSHAKTLDALATGVGADDKMIAMAQAVVSTPTTRTLAEVFLNGLGHLACGYAHA